MALKILMFRAVLCLCLTALLSAGGQIATAQSLIRDTEIEEYMRDFSDPLIKAAGLNAESVDIYVVNDGQLNAFVTRGQKVFFRPNMSPFLEWCLEV